MNGNNKSTYDYASEWETLNVRLEKKYDRGPTITVKPTDEDMDAVLDFIGKCMDNEDFKFLGNIWLNKFQKFIDNDRTQPATLRPRTPTNGSGSVNGNNINKLIEKC